MHDRCRAWLLSYIPALCRVICRLDSAAQGHRNLHIVNGEPVKCHAQSSPVSRETGCRDQSGGDAWNGLGQETGMRHLCGPQPLVILAVPEDLMLPVCGRTLCIL